jgi:FMN hydrolase / 5-amino-6-(5-phospho-D-ribitylamino)uracil phosphatase
MKYKVISFDMFQTLVDVNSRKHAVWKEILKEKYTFEAAEKLWNDTLDYHYDYTKDIKSGRKAFQPMRETFRKTYEKLFPENNIEMDSSSAVNILFREHGNSVIYQDARDFFDKINEEYRIWISSDTDMIMIQPLLNLFKHERAFLSEEIGAYKDDGDGRFFRYVLECTGVSPCEILHIGDGTADILGANKSGITTCWINRDKQLWQGVVTPDYTIESLLELKNII